jgi:hypothetical protein
VREKFSWTVKRWIEISGETEMKEAALRSHFDAANFAFKVDAVLCFYDPKPIGQNIHDRKIGTFWLRQAN